MNSVAIPSESITALAARVTRDDARFSDEDAAAAIEAIAKSEGGIEALRVHCDRLASHEVLIDTAIDLVLEDDLLRGDTLEEATAALAQLHPSLARQITRAAWLRTLLESVEQSSHETKTPFELGPLDATGQRRFVARHTIGCGAFGTVYSGIDRRMGIGGEPAPVAIKVLDSGPAVLATAMHATEEAGMARAVDHPNVVRMYDSFLEPDLGHVVVMELATAGSLERAWNTNATLAEASELVEQLCEGLTACHRVGLIHGDIKAANVLMCAPDGHEQPTPKLADFGIARSLRHPADQRRADTTSQLIMGNAAGLAPELIEGSPPSVTSDVFGLGALLLWLCTGYSIPQGEDHDQTANATRQHWLDALHERDPALHAICDKSLCGLPEGRFSNPEALRDALTAWRTGQVIPEVRIPPLPSVIRWLRSHRRAALGAATLAIASTALITLGGTTLERRAFQRGIHEAQATAASLIGDETDGRARGFRGWMETSLGLHVLGGSAALAEISAITPGPTYIASMLAEINDVEQPAGGPTLKSALWRMSLAATLLEDPTPHDITDGILNEASVFLRSTLPPSDASLETIATLEAVSVAKREALFRTRGVGTPVSGDDLNTAYETVRTYLDTASSRFTNDLTDQQLREPLDRLATRAAWHLASHHVFDDAIVHDWCSRQMAGIRR